MRTKEGAEFEKTLDEFLAKNEKLTNELIGMIGERDRQIMELKQQLSEAREVAKAYSIRVMTE